MDTATDFGGRAVPLPKSMKIMSARQAKAARAVLDLSVAALARKSGVSQSSIRRVEDGQDDTIKVDLVVRLQVFFEGQGFTFSWDESECGVKWTGKC